MAPICDPVADHQERRATSGLRGVDLAMLDDGEHVCTLLSGMLAR